MQNIVIDMCEKFRYDRLRNDRALGNGKSDNNNNNNNNNNVGSAWGPVSGFEATPVRVLQSYSNQSAICPAHIAPQ